MADPVFADLLSSLDLAIVERLPDGEFHVLPPVPVWFTTLYRQAASGGSTTLTGTFPFVDTFLDEAARFWWQNRPGRLKSGVCAAPDGHGHELHFDVSAVSVGTRRFLLFERLPEMDDTRRILQGARELAIERERLHARLKACRGKAEAALRAVKALESSTLPAVQAEAAENVTRSLEALLKAIGTDS